MAAKKTRFEGQCPILCVRDLSASVDYYIRVLGFQQDWSDPDMASVSRDSACIYLCRQAQGQPGTWVWIGVEDAAALYEEYRETGASIYMEPANFYWAYEFRVADPDGHILRFGSEPK